MTAEKKAEAAEAEAQASQPAKDAAACGRSDEGSLTTPSGEDRPSPVRDDGDRHPEQRSPEGRGASSKDPAQDASQSDAQTSSTEGVSEADTDAQGEPQEATEPAPDLAAELAAAKMEAAGLRDRYTRLQAEWDNFRKRTAAERESEKARAAEKLVVDLLPVLDDMERAIKHAAESGDGSSLVEGVEAIQGKFLQILGKHKVEQVEAEGVAFDANIHQAIGTVEDDSVPEETVVQVYQQGYKMGDRVIRPAMVVTSTK